MKHKFKVFKITNRKKIMKYEEFIKQREQYGNDDGFEPLYMPDCLFDFQKHLTQWALRKGRAALFEDCGLGKTIQALVWSQNVVMKTNKPVLIISPLAVSHQIKREADKFDIEASISIDGTVKKNITITNYEKLLKFNSNDFSGVVCDESSILKNYDGAFKQSITEFMRKLPYRLLTTATAAPNDYIELGTSSEALGYLGFMDILNKYFKNTNNDSGMKKMYGEAPQWVFKAHAEEHFWKFISFWARACRKPSDIGFSDELFKLEPYELNEYSIETPPMPGLLFNIPARTLLEQRSEKKRTIPERVNKVCELIESKKGQSIVWCQFNDEGIALKKAIKDSVEVSGSDSDEKKTEAFLGFANGEIKVLITKPKIGGFGMNWQNCNHVVYFPSHSYEQYYQCVRRCWRFGQKKKVNVDIVLTESERRIMQNLEHKSKQAENMFKNLIIEMNHSLNDKKINTYTKKVELPKWL